jgi:pyruvate/2-oxoglutarate dehydrogenase complex dihydrolipoamide acyltransferase (E2) component
MPDALGPHLVIDPSPDRRFSMDAFAALPSSHLMIAFLEIDVTRAAEVLETMRGRGERVSLFAFLVHAIAATIAEHPDMNLVRHGSRFVRFADVDVAVPIEVRTPDGHFPRQVVLRRAHAKSAAELFAEIEAAKVSHLTRGETSAEDAWNRRLMAGLGFLPRWARIAIIRWVMRSAYRIKERAGTTLVTSVGKFASIPGFVSTLTTGPRAATFAIGGVVDKPWAHEGAIALRKIQSLSIMIDHDLVDGGPAARFGKRLVDRIERAEGLAG